MRIMVASQDESVDYLVKKQLEKYRPDIEVLNYKNYEDDGANLEEIDAILLNPRNRYLSLEAIKEKEYPGRVIAFITKGQLGNKERTLSEFDGILEQPYNVEDLVKAVKGD